MSAPVVFVDEPGYRLKLRRAKQHLETIDRDVRAFIEFNLAGAVPFETKPEKEWTIFKRGDVKPISPLFGAFLGDFIHNARSALDNLVVAMIRRNDPGHSVEHAYFPAYDGSAKWRNEIVTRDRTAHGPAPTDGVSDAVLTAIEKSQPYRTKPMGVSIARTPLMLLQAASNTDKHQAIHATTPRIPVPGRIIGPNLSVPRGRLHITPPGYFKMLKSRVAAPGTPLETGAEIGRAKIRVVQLPPPNVEVGVNASIPMEIAFSVEGKSGEITHWDLWDMANEAWRVVLRVEEAAGIHGLPRQDAYEWAISN